MCTPRPCLIAAVFALAWWPSTVLGAPEVPKNFGCHPSSNSRSDVRVAWTDTNDGDADYIVQRRLVSPSSDWETIETVPGSATKFQAFDEENVGVYDYRVIATFGGGDNAPPSDICREPSSWDDEDSDENGGFRIFWRTVNCPPVDDGQVCTQAVDIQLFGGGTVNKHAHQIGETLQRYRETYMGMGFDDPAIFESGIDSQRMPVDLYPKNSGFFTAAGKILIPPERMEGPDYNPATGGGTVWEYSVMGHELFHGIEKIYGWVNDPFGKWVHEGQARAMEDKTFPFTNATWGNIWDDQAVKSYEGQMKKYLDKPEVNLLEQSYSAAIFWVKVMEEFGNPAIAEPAFGSDVMLRFWEQNRINIADDEDNEAKDGIATLNDMLANDDWFVTDRRFVDLFKDFAVANYAKEFISFPIPLDLRKYNYIDEESSSSYGKVKLTRDEPLGFNQSVFGTTFVDAWAARYFEVQPDPSLPVVNIKAEALNATQHELYFHVLGIDSFGDIVHQHSATGTSYEHSVSLISQPLDRVALVVAGLEYQTNFDYSFNLSEGIFILSPTTQQPANVGSELSPRKFHLHFQVLDEDLEPVAGVDVDDLVIRVNGQLLWPSADPLSDPLISSTYVAGQYVLVLRAPSFPGCDLCDISIEYNDFADAQAEALAYGDSSRIDNMVVIDRSNSMEGDKFIAAQDAGRLYVDLYDTGDRIGVVSYSSSPKSEYPLTPWDLTTRLEAQDAIDDINSPNGNTATGAALRVAMQELIDEELLLIPHDWTIILLSDGKDSVEDENDHLPAFMAEYEARKDDGEKVPVIHVVAVGDDADGGGLQNLATKSGGTFKWLDEVEAVSPAPGFGVAAAPSATPEEFTTELAEIYRVIAETVTDEQQIYARHENVPIGQTVQVIRWTTTPAKGCLCSNGRPPPRPSRL